MPVVPTTGEALLILLSTVLPGAMFTFAFERRAGSSKPPAADRLLRYVATSAAFDLAYAPPLYLVRDTVTRDGLDPSRFTLLWLAAVVGLALPATLGTVVGGLYGTRRTREGWRFVRRLLSARGETRLLALAVGTPAPRAWDHVFAGRTRVFLRIQRSDGAWIGGRYGDASFAGRFPHDGDLYLEEVWPIGANGDFGSASLGYGLYIPAASIVSIEVVDDVNSKEDSHV